MPDDVVMQKLASIDRCLRAVRDYVAGDIARLHEPIVLDAVVLNLQRACEQAIDAACPEVGDALAVDRGIDGSERHATESFLHGHLPACGPLTAHAATAGLAAIANRVVC